MDNASPSPNAQSGLWYCARCSKLIHPPGSAGIVVNDEHFCTACAEAAKPQVAEASTPPMRRSRTVITPARATPSSTATRASSRSQPAPQAEPAFVEKKPFPVGIAFAVGGGLLLIVGLVLILTSGSGPAVAKGGPTNSAPDASMANPAPIPNPAVAKPAVSPVKPNDGSADPAPMVRAPVDLSKPPEKPSLTPLPQAAPAPPKPAPSPEDGLQAFKKELASAGALTNSEKYAAALETLNRLKTANSQAPWWESQKQAWQDAEKLVQQRAAELATEADDARGQAAKCDKTDVLDKLEATWKPRAAGTSSGEGWTLLEPLTFESSSGVTLTRQPDGSVLAGGVDPEKDVYTVTAQTSLIGITAFRLDAMTDPSLEGNGPGRHQNFVMSEFSAQAAPLNGGAMRAVSLVKPSVDYCQRDAPVFAIECALDGNPNSGWAVAGGIGRPHTAVFETATPLADGGGQRLAFKLEFNSQWGRHIIGRFRLSATTAKTPQNGTAALSASPQAQPAADTLVSQPARGVLKAIAESRARIAEQARQKRSAEITAKLDAIERQIKSRTRADPIFKGLDEIEGLAAQDADAAEKFGERIGGARFDALAMRDGDLSVYRTAVRQAGAGAEVLYDFATPEQYGIWFYDNPANAGSAEHDLKKGAVILKSAGRHNWDGKDRRGMPVFRIPFYFRPDNWMVETDVSLLSDQNKGNKPDIGILVWDGSTNVVRLSVQDSARGLHAVYGSSMPKRENFWARPVSLAGKIKDKIRLQMSCSGGMVGCTVTSSTGASVTIAKEALGFEPQFVGLFIRNNDDGENASAAFQSVKIQGVPNAERLKELRDTRRSVAASTAKQDLLRRNQSLKFLAEGQFIPLPLDKAATWPSTKRMFLGATDEERLVFPAWGMQMSQGVPFFVGDPKGDTVNNIVLLNGPLGKVCAAMPQSVVLPVNASASAIHILGGVSGWGFPNGEARSVSMLVRIQYDDNQMEEHKLLNGVQFADYIRVVDVPESKLAFTLGQQQVRYLALRVTRPSATIKTIEFAKGDDKTAPVLVAATLDRRINLSGIVFSNTSPKVVAEGKVGKAMAFGGKDFVEVPHAVELDPEKMTVEAWIYLEQYPTGETRRWLVNKNSNEGVNGHYALMINGANVGAYLNIGGEFSAWNAGGVQLKQWQHLAFTYDGAILKIYLNGAQAAATPVNRPRVPAGTPLAIGRRQDGYVGFMGLLDEVRVYNRALPDDEIKAHFQKPGEASKDGQVGYWSFD